MPPDIWRKGVNLLGELDYFHYWPYQSAFVAWMALFIRLFGADVVFFKLTNCLFSALSTLLVYLLAKRFASEWGARVASSWYWRFWYTSQSGFFPD
jgi:4-amino-4-deoxy-L-arabinose transferase-like glycosyltransferase